MKPDSHVHTENRPKNNAIFANKYQNWQLRGERETERQRQRERQSTNPDIFAILRDLMNGTITT